MKGRKGNGVLTVLVGFSLVGLLVFGVGCGDDHDYVVPPGIGGGASPSGDTVMLRITDPVSADPLEVAFPIADPVSADPLEVISLPHCDREQAVVKIIHLFLELTHNRATETFSLEVGGIITVDVRQVPLNKCTIADLTVEVTETVRWVSGELPTEGAFKITVSDHIITVTVNPDVDGAGNPGVDIAFDQWGDGIIEDQISLTWEELEEIMDRDAWASKYQRIAAFGFRVYELLVARARLGLELLTFVMEEGTDLEAAGVAGVLVTCHEFPPGSGSSGSRHYVWEDASGDGVLGTGDNFAVTYNTTADGCWIDHPDQTIDTLYRGTISLNDYVEQSSPLQIGGDIVFEEFRETETEEEPPGQFTKEDQPSGITNGGFNVLLETTPPAVQTFDFDDLPTGNIDGENLGGVTLTSPDGSTRVVSDEGIGYRSPFNAVTNVRFLTQNPLTLTFDFPVSAVTLTGGDRGFDLDQFTVTAFNEADEVLESVTTPVFGGNPRREEMVDFYEVTLQAPNIKRVVVRAERQYGIGIDDVIVTIQ